MKTQLMLVSAQAAPNLLAAADSDLRPGRAILVTSRAMQARADALAKVLRETGIEVARCALRDEHQPREIEEDLLALARTLDGTDVHLNVTGGTKVMALAALAVAEAAGWTAFYVDVDTDHVVWLGREPLPPRKLNENVRLRHYLRAYGIEIEGELARRSSSPAQQSFIEQMLLFYDRYLPALPLLNAALQRAEDARSLTVELTEAELDSKSLGELLDATQAQGLLSLAGARLKLADEACRDFLKGGWLEQHVFDTVSRVASQLPVRDRAVNVTVRQGAVRNELDVAFLCRNRLHVIECKTANLRSNQGERANEALFKLAENARRLGGLATRSMLISYRGLRDPELRLAQVLQIEVAHGRDVPRLAERMLTWCGR